ncbi:hypothetical protein WUBG_15830, partial [Wuchereria bancrofti]
RLKTLIKRLHTDKLLLNRYNKIIQEQMESNIIEEVTPELNQVGFIYHLPRNE